MQLFASLHVSEPVGGWVVLPGQRAEMTLGLFVGVCVCDLCHFNLFFISLLFFVFMHFIDALLRAQLQFCHVLVYVCLMTAKTVFHSMRYKMCYMLSSCLRPLLYIIYIFKSP